MLATQNGPKIEAGPLPGMSRKGPRVALFRSLPAVARRLGAGVTPGPWNGLRPKAAACPSGDQREPHDPESDPPRRHSGVSRVSPLHGGPTTKAVRRSTRFQPTRRGNLFVSCRSLWRKTMSTVVTFCRARPFGNFVRVLGVSLRHADRLPCYGIEPLVERSSGLTPAMIHSRWAAPSHRRTATTAESMCRRPTSSTAAPNSGPESPRASVMCGVQRPGRRVSATGPNRASTPANALLHTDQGSCWVPPISLGPRGVQGRSPARPAAPSSAARRPAARPPRPAHPPRRGRGRGPWQRPP